MLFNKQLDTRGRGMMLFRQPPEGERARFERAKRVRERARGGNLARLAGPGEDGAERASPEGYREHLGFTLFETVFTIALTSAVLAALVGLVFAVSDVRNTITAAQEVHAQTRSALHIFTRTVQAARAINTGSSVFGSDPGVLSLAVADPSSDPTVIRLNQDNGILQIQYGVQTPVSITSDEVQIQNLVFTNLSQPGERQHIRIQLTARYGGSSTSTFTYAQSVQTAASFRR